MDVNEQERAPRTLVDYIGLAARGFAMGTSDIVPGVSGGTMALILGIYEELIDSIRAVLNPQVFKLLLRLKIKEALDLVPWKFLLAVASGIFVAVFTMSHFLHWLLANHPSRLWAFFFGLVLASVLAVGRRVKKWGVKPLLAALAGAVSAYVVVGLVPMHTPNTWWSLFLSGALAICAMVLPGISGAFILVLLGKYRYLLAAVTRRDLGTLLLVVSGAGVGIVTIAQVLGWLFKKYHDVTVALLTGMLLGSLRKIWPWKETIEFILDHRGEPVPVRQINVLPAALTLEVLGIIVLCVVGFALITTLNARAARSERAELQG
jgi:putative membrane protein